VWAIKFFPRSEVSAFQVSEYRKSTAHLTQVCRQAPKRSDVLQQRVVWKIQTDQNLIAWIHTMAVNTLLQLAKCCWIHRRRLVGCRAPAELPQLIALLSASRTNAYSGRLRISDSRLKANLYRCARCGDKCSTFHRLVC